MKTRNLGVPSRKAQKEKRKSQRQQSKKERKMGEERDTERPGLVRVVVVVVVVGWSCRLEV